MELFAFLLFVFVSILGLISLVFGLPGTFVILCAAILYGWYQGFSEVTPKVLVVLGLLAVFGEVLEFIMSVAGAKRQKSSKSAVLGSIVGGIAGAVFGAPFLFGIGSVIGAFLGAFVGAFLVELLKQKTVEQALRSGWGAFCGRLFGAFAKGVIGIIMITVVVLSVRH
ncbi:MAG: hypothetical protein KatS3mg078_2233 [Deltaproteobacteria bacterium]|nr:MAG: hypothetical protein KatS3mg078_2233 [Deltaproteobacteria bacterium]